MTIHSLVSTSIKDLVNVFNIAFEDYFIPIQFNEETLLDKIKSDNILLEYSIGVSIDNKLVAFILIGIDTKNNQFFSYNAGTGVIPTYRGKHLPKKMYGYLLPLLNKSNIRNHQLEVIVENHKALQVYQNIGYQINRKVTCFKGTITPPKKDFPFKLLEFELEETFKIETFWNHQPTYQNTLSSINRNIKANTFLGAFIENELIGYIIYANRNNRIRQFGVDKSYRKKTIGHHLFYEVQKVNPNIEVSLINVESNDKETIQFLEKIGLKSTISQYEMIK